MQLQDIQYRAYNPTTKTMLYSNEAPSLSEFFSALEMAKTAGIELKIMKQTPNKDCTGKPSYEDDLCIIKGQPFCSEPYSITYDDFDIPCFLHPERFGVCVDFKEYFIQDCGMNRDGFKIVGNKYEGIKS